MNDKEKAPVSAFAPLICSTAADQDATIECGECGVLTSPDRADFAEGDGDMIPDSWVCHKCQSSVPDDPHFYSDLDDDDLDDIEYECEECGEWSRCTCFDDDV